MFCSRHLQGGSPTAITLINNYGDIHPGLNQLSTGIDGQPKMTPIYVAPDAIVKGPDELTPKEEVQIWFEQDIETSTMFSVAKSSALTIDLTQADDATYLYSDGGWSVPPILYVSQPTTILTIILTTTVAISATLLSQKIAAKLTGVYQDITVDVSVADQKFTVKYQEKTGLKLEQAEFLRTLMLAQTIRDVLMNFTVNSLAEMHAAYNTLTAS